MHPLSLNYWFSSPSTNPNGYYMAMTIGLGVLFLVSLFVYWRRAKLARFNPILRRFLRRIAGTGMWIAGIGLFLAGMRYAQVEYLSVPALMLALFVALIIMVGYYIYDLSERYPVAMHGYEESQLHRRYRPSSGPKRQTEPVYARPGKLRGKRRR